jgi:uncharacterized protein YqjF (DUF2071 family)
VPPELELQEFDGSCWLGLVPFRMAGVMRRPLPDLPWVSAFPELNVRTYVERDGKPGVWFLSLDATNPLAVWAARQYFHLPYFRAQMKVTDDGDGFRYRSRRPRAAFAGTFRPSSDAFLAAPGSLEHFLTERYCLYARSPDGLLFRSDVHHHPWPLQMATADITHNTMFEVHGISVAGEPLCHFARRIDVVIWDAECC